MYGSRFSDLTPEQAQNRLPAFQIHSNTKVELGNSFSFLDPNRFEPKPFINCGVPTTFSSLFSSFIFPLASTASFHLGLEASIRRLESSRYLAIKLYWGMLWCSAASWVRGFDTQLERGTISPSRHTKTIDLISRDRMTKSTLLESHSNSTQASPARFYKES